MAVAIVLVAHATFEPTEFDGRMVAAYDPTFIHPSGYEGGLLEVTDDPAKAMRFPSLFAAVQKYRESFGWREDGEPNRPLTEWTVTFCDVPDEAS